jgi:hypothetical protein
MNNAISIRTLTATIAASGLILGLGSTAQAAEMIDPAAANPTSSAPAAAGGSSQSHSDLALQATNPVAPLIQLQLQNIFIPKTENAGGYANQFIVQPVIPIAKNSLIPLNSVLRPTIPIVSSADIGGPDGTTGLGDIAWVYVLNAPTDWGIVGVGGAGAIPTATDLRLGSRKWQLGPSVFGLYTKIPNVQLGALVFNNWSVGGSGPNDLNSMSIQIVANKHWGDGWYAGWGDQALNFNWKTNQNYIPISARLGKVFTVGKQPVNLFGQGIYNVGDAVTGQPQWGFKLNVTLLFPES